MSIHRCCLLCIMLQAITLRSMSRRLSELVQMPCPFARLQSIPAHGFHLELTHRSEHVCSEPRQTWAPPRWNLPSWSPGEFNGSELRKPHASIPAACSSGSRGPAHRTPHRAAVRLPTRALKGACASHARISIRCRPRIITHPQSNVLSGLQQRCHRKGLERKPRPKRKRRPTRLQHRINSGKAGA